MAKGKQQSASAARRRESERQQRQQRLAVKPTAQARSRSSGPKMRKRGWNQNYMIGIVLLLIAVIIGAFILISRLQSNTGSGQAVQASSQVFNQVTKVDPNILAQVGNGSLSNPFKTVSGSPPLLKGPTGKPEILYIGAEYCPFCAAERWPMVVALSRFGSFSKLYQTTSSSVDVDPSTPTFTFYQATYKGAFYSSQYIDFVPVELSGNEQQADGTYPTLQTPTTVQKQLLSTYDVPPYTDASSAGSIPFLDIANKYVQIGAPAGFSPQSLSGMQWSEIAGRLADSNSSLSKQILGSANYLTAAICIATNQQPGSVCNTDAIQKIESTFGKTGMTGHNGPSAIATAPDEASLRKTAA